MRVVIAPDKFKGSLPADAVGEALAAGIARVVAADVDLVPMADGGDGTVEAALRAGYTASRHSVTGPVGEQVEAVLAVRGDTAVVELATASGLALLPPDSLAPLTATSRGTGELVAAALDAGCTRIVLGVGGSACTDGGAGLLAALGIRLLDAGGRPLADGGAALADLAEVDLTGLDPRVRHTEFVVALDVDNPLLGENGAAAIFGPQKGASPDEVGQLNDALAHFARVLATTVGPTIDAAAAAPGAGAAGGVGFAALAVLGATPQTGLELVADLVGLADRVRGADLVITGEGSLDQQSLAGKTPVGVARIARAAGVPRVTAVCGVSTLDEKQATAGGFDAVWTLADLESDVARSITNAAELLTQTGEQIGRWIATKES
ncbi:MAG TPA: glycerate kinase [Flexivirga sp.]|uniref:glycerate kinase n=1 Tax=Flexivirga sp. TaxID=1962927 RepID=UPI002D057446|nr:glycerate kinase [Flexivirga sp.]HWC24146.1 glycerate kinase [Flexivirga sp.]